VSSELQDKKKGSSILTKRKPLLQIKDTQKGSLTNQMKNAIVQIVLLPGKRVFVSCTFLKMTQEGFTHPYQFKWGLAFGMMAKWSFQPIYSEVIFPWESLT
jgi:hypothetical protein